MNAAAGFPPPEVIRFLNSLPALHIILQQVWAASQWMTIVGTLVYTLTAIKIPGLAVVFYTIADLGAIFTYAIVVYRRHFLTNPFASSFVPLSEAIKSENFHLLMLAFLWLITPCQLLKIIPFYLYSLLNVAHYYSKEVLNPLGGFSQALTPLITYFEGPILIVASHIDLLLFPIIFIQSIIKGSFFGLIIFFFIWCLKLECSEASRRSIYTVLDLISRIFMQPNIPPHVRYHWFLIRRRVELLIPLRTGYRSHQNDMRPVQRVGSRRGRRSAKPYLDNDASSILYRY